MKLHEPGECPDSLYGEDCNGIGQYVPSPYAQEIYDDDTPGWYCEGVLIGSAMDI